MASPGPIKLLRTIPTSSAANTVVVGDGAPLDSPAFTGTPTAPTPTAGDNSTQIATTEFVDTAAASAAAAAVDAAVSGTVGALAKIASASSVTSTDLTGDVTTSSTPAATVVKIQGVPVSTATPVDQQVLQYYASQSKWLPDFGWGPWFSLQAAGVTTSWVMNGLYAGVALFNAGGTNAAATASLPPGVTFTTSSSGGTSAGWNAGNSASVGGAPMQFWREIQWTVALSQTANCRIWMGMADATAINSATNFRSDTPSINFVGFRYSTAVPDSKYQCCTLAGASRTINAETTASHVDTSSHKFAIRWDDTNVVFLIDNVQVGSQSANVTTNALFPVFYIDNVSLGNTRGFTFYNMFGVGKTY